MGPLIPLTEAYFTRGNIPFGSDNTSTDLLTRKFIWLLKACLADQITTGTTSGTRHANSIWTVLGSGNGTTGALDAVDRWPAPFNAANIVRNTTGNAHSWAALRNSHNGYDICIDANTPNPAQASLIAVKGAVGFTGGTNTARPVSIGNSEEFGAGTNSVGTGFPFNMFGDTTTNQPHWFHFGTNASGTRWWAAKSRSGTQRFDCFIGFWQADGRPGDTRNQWWIYGGVNIGGRGTAMAGAITTTNGCIRRGYLDTSPPPGGVRNFAFGTANLSNNGVDLESGNYISTPLELAIVTPLVDCGIFPDLAFITGGTVGASIPSAAAMERTINGDLIHPCGVTLTT